MSDTVKQYGFYSKLAVAAGCGTRWYAKSDGSQVEVVGVYSDPEAPLFLWEDKKSVGEVSCWLRAGQPTSGAIRQADLMTEQLRRES